MSFFVRAQSFLRNLFSSDRVDADLDEEVHSHLEMLTQENLRAGMGEAEAKRSARIELGGIEQLKEQVREQLLGNWLHSVISDFRYGVRSLFKDRRLAVLAIFALALGIGASTVVFSVLYDGLLNPFPYKDSRGISIFHIHDLESAGNPGRGFFSCPNSSIIASKTMSFPTWLALPPLPSFTPRTPEHNSSKVPTSPPTLSLSSGFRLSSDVGLPTTTPGPVLLPFSL